ncbi:MAG: hypothetical protein K2Z81_17970, partial [Cyanobacteria bacterium]|nr:hypothetical protein [Cyanobacteriota bacterium]
MPETDTITPEVFALLVQRMLASVSPYRWLLHSESFTLFTNVGADQYALRLAGMYEKFVATEGPESLFELQKQLQAFMAPGERHPATNVLSSILPYMRSHIGLIRDNDRLAADQPPEDDLVFFPFADVLAVGLVIDSGDKQQQVRYSDLAELGLSVEEAIEIAVENLARRSGDPFRVVQAGFYASPWKDSFDGARLLLPNLFSQLQVDGEIVAMAPYPDTLLVTGSKDFSGLSMLVSLSDKMIKERYAVYALPMVLRNGVWEPFEVGPDDPVFDIIHSFRLSILNLTYCEQERFLVYKRVDKQKIFASPYLLERDKRNGYQYSKTNIVEDRINNFPECDVVEFFRFNTEGTRDCVARAPFSKVIEQLSPLLSEDRSFRPVRWQLSNFPKGSDLAALGMMLPGKGLLDVPPKSEATRTKESLETFVSMPVPAGAHLVTRSDEKEKDFILEFAVKESSDALKKIYLQSLNVKEALQAQTDQGDYLIVQSHGALWTREAWFSQDPQDGATVLLLIKRVHFNSAALKTALKKQSDLLRPFEQLFGISLLLDMKPVGTLVITRDNASQGFRIANEPEN